MSAFQAAVERASSVPIRDYGPTLSRLLANQSCVTGGEGNFSSESYRDKRLYLKL
jgi:hypothetical protein